MKHLRNLYDRKISAAALAAVICVTAAASGCSAKGNSSPAESSGESPAAMELGMPVISENAELPGESETQWDCVYFGSYPAAEVVKDGFSAVEDYAFSEGDVISDPALFEQLEGAEWDGCDTVLDGVRYRRLRFSGTADEAGREQHYKWDDGWHYFRFEPIKWRVIGLEGDTAELMADRQLDCEPYNEKAGDVYWESCTLRSFLNGYGSGENSDSVDFSGKPQDSFFGTAFTDEEKKAVIRTAVETPDNYYFGTDCGGDTQDFVYIQGEQDIFMTEDAVRSGFAKSDATRDTARRFRPTVYAMAKGAWYSPVETNLGNGFWFVRTCGYTPSNVNYICDFGSVFNRGTYVTADDAGLIPVIRIDLTRAETEYAGKVSSGDIFIPASEESAPAEGETEAVPGGRRTSGELSEPLVEEDESLSSGLKTTWDTVEFGHYPTCEIVSGDFSAVADYAVTEGDVVRDEALYSQLADAVWQDNETVIGGVRYCRLTAGDTEMISLNSPQHYQWDSEDSFHYFRYEPITWRVAECDGSQVMLISNRELDCAPFNTVSADVTWENCTLRSFLNGYGADMNSAGVDYSHNSFIGRAFSDEEQQHIAAREVEAPDNNYYGTKCGSSTVDKVFILSCDEVFAGPDAAVHGFYPGKGVDDPAKRFRPTMYAMARGTWYSPVEGYRGNGFWYMRTNGYTLSNATYICDFGYIYNRGTNVACNDAGLLPAMWVDISGLDMKCAGQVSSG